MVWKREVAGRREWGQRVMDKWWKRVAKPWGKLIRHGHSAQERKAGNMAWQPFGDGCTGEGDTSQSSKDELPSQGSRYLNI